MHFKEAKGILSARNGMNIFRGCTHGCIYCDSRSKCYQINHDFEDVEVKSNAPELLELALRRKRKKCMISTGSMSDPYIPIENKIRYTRKCLEIIDKYGFGLAIQTKSNRILRDLDLLKSINKKSKCVVQITLTTYNEELCQILEPNVCASRDRFEVLKIMRDNGIPTVVWLGPILPFINDTEENIRGLMDYCTEAEVHAVLSFGMGVTLREGDREYFYMKLDEHFPGLKEKYHNKYGYSYEVGSDNNQALMKIVNGICERNGIMTGPDRIFKYVHEFPEEPDMDQLSFFNC